MTIIIKIPQPDTEYRLALVPVNDPHLDGERDATPADLERAGYVPLAAFVGPLDLLSPPTLAGALEAIAGDARDNEYANIVRAALGALGAAPGVHLVEECARVRGRAEKAEADCREQYIRLLGALTPIREAIGAPDNADTLGWLKVVLAKAEHEADEASDERDRAIVRAEKAEQELRAMAERAGDAERERDAARAELARLTAPAEGSAASLPPATHTAQSAQDRATDEELAKVAYDVDQPLAPAIHWQSGGALVRRYAAMARAVAAHVRKERCLVAQAVGMLADVRVEENRTRPGWYVRVTIGETTKDRCDTPPADVPAALAHLLGGVAWLT